MQILLLLLVFFFFRGNQIRNIEILMSASSSAPFPSCPTSCLAAAAAVAVAATSLICSRRHANAVRCQVARCPTPAKKFYITNTHTHTLTLNGTHTMGVCVCVRTFRLSSAFVEMSIPKLAEFVLSLANDNVDSCLPQQFALNFELRPQTGPVFILRLLWHL